MKLLGQYNNGNYKVSIFNDGTKIRENNLDFFESEFPENIDIKITNRCNMGCLMCHENSSKDGNNGNILTLPFLDSLRPYTELAIGGGNVFENPSFVPFLYELKKRKIIANMTINQLHFEENYNLVKYLIDNELIYGVGVSLSRPSEYFISLFKYAGKNLVLHVINGIVSQGEIERYLKNKEIKILFLGYKDFGRGINYFCENEIEIKKNQQYIYENLDKILKWFKIVSFDNLAIEQMKPERFMTKKQYDEFYMGDEGQFTMYIDAVKEKFGKNSISKERYPITSNIVDMFNTIKKET